MQNSSVMNKHSDIQGERIAWSHFWINKGLIAVEVLLFFYIENLIRKSLGEYEFRNNSVLLLQTPFQIFQKIYFYRFWFQNLLENTVLEIKSQWQIVF